MMQIYSIESPRFIKYSDTHIRPCCRTQK